MVLDFETPPFGDQTAEIYPFVAEIWDGENRLIFWDENPDVLIDQITAYFESLDPDIKWICYAHNGGKFDWMFFVKKLRGYVSFKGRSLMSAKLGNVELRDSLHILPAGLANYKKDAHDVGLHVKSKRNIPANKAKILAYLHSDCVYLYDLVKSITDRHGFKLSIGQMALGLLKNQYPIETLSEHADEYLRQWFFGGRVECLQGPGIFEGDLALDDINSSYPFVMAEYEHPIGAQYSVRSIKYGGRVFPNAQTVFLEIECTNYGALCAREDDFTLTFNKPRGVFKTTIWEYETALRLGLIENVKIRQCIDFPLRTNFAKVVRPLYENRQRLKGAIDEQEDGAEKDEMIREDLNDKFLLNNMWGKTAQNSRDFCEYFYTNFDEAPPGELVAPMKYEDEDGGFWTMDASREPDFIVWKKPVQIRRFINVATGASVTGAARSRLLEKIASVENPLYCDTDCVIYAGRGEAGKSNELGAWKREADITRLLIGGKKLYGYTGTKEKIRCKGAPNLAWQELEAIAAGKVIAKTSKAPKISKTGHQEYTTRKISVTCPRNYRSRIFERGIENVG